MSYRWSALLVKLRPYLTATTYVYWLLAGVFGSIPLLSLIKRLLAFWNWNIDLVALPRLLVEEWQRLRTAIFRPIADWLTAVISLPEWAHYVLVTWVPDLLAIYFLLV